jgi:acetyltransferase-like isoleucine patch superfamily enzyme
LPEAQKSIKDSGSVLLDVLGRDGKSVAWACFISGRSHCYTDVSVNFCKQDSKIDAVVIGKNVRIGSNSVVLPGVKIGDNSVIGAGSTVVKDVPPYTVTAGKPAKVIKQYDSQARQRLRV